MKRVKNIFITGPLLFCLSFAATEKPYQLHNLAYQSFLRRSFPNDTFAASYFRQHVVTPYQDVFSSVASRWLEKDNLVDFLQAIKRRKNELQKVDSVFPAMFDKSWMRFKKIAPDLKNGTSVYLLPAPRSAIGGSVRPLAKEDVVIFGAAEIASVMGTQRSFDVLVQHELTHLYHMQLNKEMRQMVGQVYMPPYAETAAKLYQVLWLEGLAVFESKKLNPSATDQEILLSSTVATDVRSLWPSIGNELSRLLESSRQDDINRFLFDSDRSGRIPRRSGYYIGMLIAKKLSMKYSFAGLCQLQGQELKTQIAKTLKELENSSLQ